MLFEIHLQSLKKMEKYLFALNNHAALIIANQFFMFPLVICRFIFGDELNLEDLHAITLIFSHLNRSLPDP